MIPDEDGLRADARLNRGRILDVARDALVSDPEASMSAIAKMAGVGQGTLYRHFPTRGALLLGVFRREIEGVIAFGPTLLADHPPLQAFRLWCDRLAEFGRAKQGVADALHAALSDGDVQEIYPRLLGTVGQLLEASACAGEISPGADPRDVLLLLSALWRIPSTAAGKAQTERLIDFIFRGLAAENPLASEGRTKR